MPLIQELKFILRKLNRSRADHDLEQEILAHIELETEQNIEAGMSPDEARLAALRSFGNATLAKEDTRAVWGFGSLESLLAERSLSDGGLIPRLLVCHTHCEAQEIVEGAPEIPGSVENEYANCG